MHTQLETTVGHHPHPPHTETELTTESHQLRRVGTLDRAALHLGLALVRWGRRPLKGERSERLAFNREVHEARREMERARAAHQAYNLTRIR